VLNQRVVDLLNRLVDNEVLIGQPIDHWFELRFAARQVGETARSFAAVVRCYDAAVREQSVPSVQSFWRKAISFNAPWRPRRASRRRVPAAGYP